MKPWLKLLLQVIGGVLVALTGGAGAAAYMANDAAPNFAVQQPGPPMAPIFETQYYLVQFEYEYAKPTSYPGPAHTERASAKVISYRQPGYSEIAKIGAKLKPQAATLVRVLGVDELEDYDAWPGNWIDLRPKKKADDDI